MEFPRMLKVRQRFDRPLVEDIEGTVRQELESLSLSSQIKPGETVAVTVGSRGIANITTIIKTIVETLKSHEAVPFIVPAMGSHGGGTAEGQRKIVEGYGLTEEFLIGEIESGLHKMMLIGLGKHAGAKIYHQAIHNYSFDEIIRAVAEQVLDKCGIIGGLAIVENAYDETGLIQAVSPDEFYEKESELCRQSKEWLPRLPFSEVDVLIVDQIGKNISGTGLDTNIVGRKYNDHEAREGDSIRINRIFVRGLTEETHGNGHQPSHHCPNRSTSDSRQLHHGRSS